MERHRRDTGDAASRTPLVVTIPETVVLGAGVLMETLGGLPPAGAPLSGQRDGAVGVHVPPAEGGIPAGCSQVVGRLLQHAHHIRRRERGIRRKHQTARRPATSGRGK